MSQGEAKSEFFVTSDAARIALAKLPTLIVHPQFWGYLAAVETSVRERRLVNLRVNFGSFFERYLTVTGAPREKPYLQPFSESASGTAQLFNRNVAGSYAPSSVREVAPIRAVLGFEKVQNVAKHRLKPDHEEIAAKVLVGQRVPAHSLATFLLRDHRIARMPSQSEPESVLRQFCVLFGYNLDDPESLKRFNTLYVLDAETFDGVNYAEEIE